MFVRDDNVRRGLLVAFIEFQTRMQQQAMEELISVMAYAS